MTASSAVVLSNLAYLIGAVVLATIGGSIVWWRHRQPRSIYSNVESFHRGLQALAPDARHAAGNGIRPVASGGLRIQPESAAPAATGPAADPTGADTTAADTTAAATGPAADTLPDATAAHTTAAATGPAAGLTAADTAAAATGPTADPTADDTTAAATGPAAGLTAADTAAAATGPTADPTPADTTAAVPPAPGSTAGPVYPPTVELEAVAAPPVGTNGNGSHHAPSDQPEAAVLGGRVPDLPDGLTGPPPVRPDLLDGAMDVPSLSLGRPEPAVPPSPALPPTIDEAGSESRVAGRAGVEAG